MVLGVEEEALEPGRACCRDCSYPIYEGRPEVDAMASKSGDKDLGGIAFFTIRNL